MGYYDRWKKEVPFSTLIGKTLVSVENTEEEVRFTTTEGEIYTQYHDQDCCEDVSVDSIVGDLDDLVGSPILKAEEASQSGSAEYDWSSDDNEKKVSDWPNGIPVPEYVQDSFTWTFYKLATIKGSVDIRWFGGSNGYYSESVSFCHENKETVQ